MVNGKRDLTVVLAPRPTIDIRRPPVTMAMIRGRGTRPPRRPVRLGKVAQIAQTIVSRGGIGGPAELPTAPVVTQQQQQKQIVTQKVITTAEKNIAEQKNIQSKISAISNESSRLSSQRAEIERLSRSLVQRGTPFFNKLVKTFNEDVAAFNQRSTNIQSRADALQKSIAENEALAETLSVQKPKPIVAILAPEQKQPFGLEAREQKAAFARFEERIKFTERFPPKTITLFSPITGQRLVDIPTGQRAGVKQEFVAPPSFLPKTFQEEFQTEKARRELTKEIESQIKQINRTAISIESTERAGIFTEAGAKRQKQRAAQLQAQITRLDQLQAALAQVELQQQLVQTPFVKTPQRQQFLIERPFLIPGEALGFTAKQIQEKFAPTGFEIKTGVKFFDPFTGKIREIAPTEVTTPRAFAFIGEVATLEAGFQGLGFTATRLGGATGRVSRELKGLGEVGGIKIVRKPKATFPDVATEIGLKKIGEKRIMGTPLESFRGRPKASFPDVKTEIGRAKAAKAVFGKEPTQVARFPDVATEIGLRRIGVQRKLTPAERAFTREVERFAGRPTVRRFKRQAPSVSAVETFTGRSRMKMFFRRRPAVVRVPTVGDVFKVKPKAVRRFFAEAEAPKPRPPKPVSRAAVLAERRFIREIDRLAALKPAKPVRGAFLVPGSLAALSVGLPRLKPVEERAVLKPRGVFAEFAEASTIFAKPGKTAIERQLRASVVDAPSLEAFRGGLTPALASALGISPKAAEKQRIAELERRAEREREIVGFSSLDALDAVINESVKVEQKQRPAFFEAQKFRQPPVEKAVLKEKVSLEDVILPRIKEAAKTREVLRQRLVTIPKLRDLFKPKIEEVIKIKPPTRLRPPLILLPGIKRRKKKKRVEERGFDTFVKIRGRFQKVNPKPLHKGTALALGRNIVDRASPATFKIVKGKSPPTGKKLRAPQLRKFRKPIKKGVSQAGSPLFIEKNKFRIDTPGEKAQITKKGLETLKRGFFKRKKKRKKTKRR